MNLHSELVRRSRHLQGSLRRRESCGGRGEAAPPLARCSGRRRARDWAGREARGVVCSLQSTAERARLRCKPSAARKRERETDRGAPSRQRGERGADQGGPSPGPRLPARQTSVSAAAGSPRAPKRPAGARGRGRGGREPSGFPEPGGEPWGPQEPPDAGLPAGPRETSLGRGQRGARGAANLAAGGAPRGSRRAPVVGFGVPGFFVSPPGPARGCTRLGPGAPHRSPSPAQAGALI